MERRFPFLLVVLGVLALSANAHAWKPYTHVHLADVARDEVIRDGNVWINGTPYPVRAEIVEALKRYPEFYDAGVVGPDGMPDMSYGQAIIHPTKTGQWLQLVLSKAWATKTTATPEEFAQNLAFAYGYASHAAGDMWGHTFINYYAQGVFPAFVDDHGQSIFEEFLTSPPSNHNFDGLTNALRHMITEGYVEDATHGFDANPDFGVAPNAYPNQPCTNPNVCLSDISTTGILLNAPHRFVYDALIRPTDPTAPIHAPVDDPAWTSVHSGKRGPAIDFFNRLRSKLSGLGAQINPIADLGQIVQDHVDAFHRISADANHALDVCDDVSDLEFLAFGLTGIPGPSMIKCGAALSVLGIQGIYETIVLGAKAVRDTIHATIDATVGELVKVYLDSWISEIDDGLQHWNELGLATSQGMFDPQTQREIQEAKCNPPPFGKFVQDCKAGLGLIDYFSESAKPFATEHLIEMLGYPRALKTAVDAVTAIQDAIGKLALLPFNPLEQFLSTDAAYFNELKERLIHSLVKAALHVDLDALKTVTQSPEAFIDLQVVPPAFLSDLLGISVPDVALFRSTDHQVLDTLLHLPPNHMVSVPPPLPGWPGVAVRLTDSAEFATAAFKAAADTVMQTRLLLLDGVELNHVLTNTLRANGTLRNDVAVRTYAGNPAATTPENVMVDALLTEDRSPVTTPPPPWLELIDGDHAWRKDGAPVFPARIVEKTGGNGSYPIWASCALRPAFRDLFFDWENGTEGISLPSLVSPCPECPANFPDFGDVAKADPNTAKNPPSPTVTPSVPQFAQGSTLFVSSATPFQVAATDAVFAQVDLRYQIQPPTGPASGFVSTPNPFNLTGPDGAYTVALQAQTPCFTFAGLPASAPQVTKAVTLDNTAPVITISSPAAGAQFTSSDIVTLSFSANDGAGSGVASLVATFDGQPATNGQSVDLFNLTAGTHTLVVDAADNVQNVSRLVRTFRVRATAASLLANWDKARSLGLIPDTLLYNLERGRLATAATFAGQGNVLLERPLIALFAKDLVVGRELACGTNAFNACRIAPATADRFIVNGVDLVATADYSAAEYNSDPAALAYLEKVDAAFIKGLVKPALYDAVASFLDNAVQFEHSGQRQTEVANLELVFQGILTARSATCLPSDPNCPAVDRVTSQVLLTSAAELIAVAQLPAGTLPLVQNVQTLLVATDATFVAGTLVSGALYDTLRRELRDAMGRGAVNDRLGERAQMQLFVTTLQTAVAVQCSNQTQACLQINPTVAASLIQQAQAILATL